jgi:hypothetical protein
MMSVAEYRIRNIVETTLRNHPPDCIFHPNAVDNVIKKVLGKSFIVSAEGPIGITLEDFLVEAIEAEEIYCPHEGIDRREAYYDGVNIVGWNEWSAIAHEMV